MSFWSFLEKGHSIPGNDTFGRRISSFFGRRIACRHKNVHIAKTALVSPDARIHPRTGQITIGEFCSIAPNSVLQGNIEIGENSSVQYNTLITGYGKQGDAQGLIHIGNNVRIAANCMIISANHIYGNSDIPICEQGVKEESIIIEDDVWIAGGVHITAGVTVGTGSVIGAGSVVTHDIPPYSVAAGVPAKVIKASRSAHGIDR